jgi:hypothetical protein
LLFPDICTIIALKRHPEYLPEYRHQRTSPTGPAANHFIIVVVKVQQNYLEA